MLMDAQAQPREMNGNNSLVQHTTLSELKQQGEQLFNQLPLEKIQLLQQAYVFSLPQVVWTIEGKSGFEQLLSFFEYGKHPFTFIHVFPGQLLLEINQTHFHGVLWIKRLVDQAYSGTFSVMSSYYRTSGLQPLSWLEPTAKLLLDIEVDNPSAMRQWIYELPSPLSQSESSLVQGLKRTGWQQTQTNYSLNTWHKEGYQIFYTFHHHQQKTLLHLMLSNLSVKNP